MTKSASGQDVSFGFSKVAEDDKQELVNEVFSKVAPYYDQMNDLMSAGLHRLWKDDLVAMLAPPKSDAFRVLDVAGGTGDIAFRIARASANAQVAIADMSPAMVREGRRRAEEMGLSGRCDFIVGNAEALPYPNCGFDAYTIGFGIRNVTHVERALNEAFRVLKPGGRFLCLEFSHPDSILLQPFYDAYSFAVIPAIGKVVTGDGRPYRYLVESIRTFPPQPQFKALIEAAGFSRVSWRNLAGGVVAIHSGWRI